MTTDKYCENRNVLMEIPGWSDENNKQQVENQEIAANESQAQKNSRVAIQLQYNSFFQDVGPVLGKFRLEDLPQQLFSSHKIKLISNQSSRQFRKLLTDGLAYVQLVSSSHNGLECSYNVLIGRFFLTVKVLNLHLNSEIQTDDNQFLGEGSYGKVKRLGVQKNQIAIKKIVFPKKKILNANANHLLNNQDFADCIEIRRAISEYCLYKICSMLRIGPQVIFQNTYDLVCYNNCIEFHMELCQEVGKRINLEAYQRDLKRSLKILHSLKIIHKDIKKSNTLYSPSFQSFVLSDFGLTHSVNQPVWGKTQTYFGGSPSHASEQMKKLLYKNEPGLVNLYLNDVHSLKVTLQQIANQQKIYEQQFSLNSMSIGKHVYNCEDEESYCQYVSSSEDHSLCSGNGDAEARVVIKNYSTEQNKISKDIINYYLIKSLNEFLGNFEEASNQRQLEIFRKIINENIKNQPSFQYLQYELTKIAGVIVDQNIRNDRLQLANIRNSIRMFGLNSSEVLELLSEICGKRTIPALNYSRIESYLIVSNNKNKVVIKKFKNQIINMDRHYYLYNNKSVIISLRNVIKQYLSGKLHQEKEKYEIFLFGCEVLSLQELTEAQNRELIVLLWQVFSRERIRPRDVAADSCLQLVDKIFQSISCLSKNDYLMVLGNLIKIHIKYKSLQSAQVYFIKLTELKLALQSDLTSSPNMDNDKKTQLKLDITRCILAESVYYGLIKKHQQALELCKINYIKFTEYQLNDQSVRLNILEETIRNLLELHSYGQAEHLTQEYGELTRKNCFPITSGPQFAFYYSFQGMCEFANQDYEKAIKSFEQSIECINDSLRGPNHVSLIKQSLKNLSLCYCTMNQQDKAVGYLEKALDVSLAYSQFNNYQQAIIYLQQIIIHLISLNKFNSRIYTYSDQLVSYKFRHIDSSNSSINTKFITPIFALQKLPKLNISQYIFVLKQLISAAEPYLPVFSVSYLKMCHEISRLLIAQKKFTTSIRFLFKIFKYSPKPYLFTQQMMFKVSFCNYILMESKQYDKVLKFMRKLLYFMPDDQEEFRTTIFDQMKDATLLCKTKLEHFYLYIWKYRAFSNMDNLNQAINNLSFVPSTKPAKMIWKKKLMLLKNSMSHPQQQDSEQLPQSQPEQNPQIFQQQMKQEESTQTAIRRKIRQKYRMVKAGKERNEKQN